VRCAGFLLQSLTEKFTHFTRLEKEANSCKTRKQVFLTQNYWVFGLFTSSGILGTRKHDVSETGSVSVLWCVGRKTPTQLDLSGFSSIFKYLKKWIPLKVFTA
jgi:hypothetical protein